MSYTPQSPINFDSAQLDKFFEQICLKLEPEGHKRFKFDYTQFGNDIQVLIRREFYGQRRCEEVAVDFVYKVPSSWWQHFKESHFPKWALKKWPVKYNTKVVWEKVILDRTWEFPKAYREGHPFLGMVVPLDNHRVDK